MLADGTQKLVKSLQIGDKVKTLNQNGQVVDTDVVMMMDLSHEECKIEIFLLKNEIL
jgi:hypothetical protein